MKPTDAVCMWQKQETSLMGRHWPSSQLHYMYMLLYILCTIVFRPTLTTLLYCLLVGYAMQQQVRTVGAGGDWGSMFPPDFDSRELQYLTLDSRIDVGQVINVGPGKFRKKIKQWALSQYLHIAQKSTFPLFNKAVGPKKIEN